MLELELRFLRPTCVVFLARPDILPETSSRQVEQVLQLDLRKASHDSLRWPQPKFGVSSIVGRIGFAQGRSGLVLFVGCRCDYLIT